VQNGHLLFFYLFLTFFLFIFYIAFFIMPYSWLDYNIGLNFVPKKILPDLIPEGLFLSKINKNHSHFDHFLLHGTGPCLHP